MAFLCTAYWLPLYSFARRLGHASEDALDLTQGYFALLIEKDYLGDVRLREGRFRTFLPTSFRYFLSKERDRARAQKRRGGRVLLSIDAQEAAAMGVHCHNRRPFTRVVSAKRVRLSYAEPTTWGTCSGYPV